MWGGVTARAAAEMRRPEVWAHLLSALPTPLQRSRELSQALFEQQHSHFG